MSTLYIDESKTKGYTVVAAVVLPADATEYRRALGQLRMKGQRRLHFVSESPARRRQILSTLERLGVTARAYRSDARTEAEARSACLAAVVEDLPEVRGQRIVLEQDDSIVAFDRQQLYQQLRAAGRSEVTYEHDRAVNEPLLAIPDAIAWCISRGGEWRRRADPMLAHVRDLRP